MKKLLTCASIVGLSLASLAGCEEKKPVDAVKDAVKDTADAVKDGAKDVKDAVKDATSKP